MFRYGVCLNFISCCIVLSSSQGTLIQHILNASEDLRPENLNPVDYDSLQTNLWLISRDDPIPVNLNSQLSADGVILRGIAVNTDRNVYGSRLSGIHQNDDTFLSRQSPISYISQDPVIYYDGSANAENRRYGLDGHEFSLQNPEAVLLELPIGISEGLWERPQIHRQPEQQQSISGRQNIVTDNVNIQYDERGNVPPVILPVRDVISRLPDIEVFAEGELNVPVQQYYETPVSASGALRYDSSSVNRSSVNNRQQESIDRGAWLLSEEKRLPTLDNTTEKHIEENTNIHNLDRKPYDYESVLTAEDIELLENLGILSSFFIEPLGPENATGNLTGRKNFQREYENTPVFIDRGGQSHFFNAQGENATNLGDVVLIDIPYFSGAEYHSNIPENTGIDHNIARISPYVALSENAGTPKVNKSENKIENITVFDEREILEIFQYLGLNTADLFNLSVPTSLSETKLPGKSESVQNNVNNTANISLSNNTNANISNYVKTEESETTDASTQSTNTSSSSNLNNEIEYINVVNPLSQPTVSNKRIQPRRLDEPAQNERDILSRLLKKAIPISERKLEMFKKLQIQPKPYIFGFNQDDGNGTLQHRNEASDAKGIVKGAYGYRDALGVYRNVSYIADNNGFHAVVKTNEPGTVSHNTADVVFKSETPPIAALIKMMAYRRPKLP